MTLWPLLRLGALSADLGLRLDWLAAPLALLAVVLAFLAGRQRRGALPVRRAAPWAALPLAGSALLTLLADNLLLLCAGWGLSGLWAGALRRELPSEDGAARAPDEGRPGGEAPPPRRLGAPLGAWARRALPGLDRGGDLALLLGSALLFWSLGGTWSSAGRYLPDHDPDRPLPELRAGADALTLGPALRLREIEAQLGASDERGERPVAEALRGKLLLGRPLLAALGACLGLAALGRAAAAAALGGAAGMVLALEALYLLARLRALLALAPPGATLALATLLLCAALLLCALTPRAATLARALGQRRLRPAAPGAEIATAAPRRRWDRAALVVPALLALLQAALLASGLREEAAGWPLPLLVLSPLLALLPRGTDDSAAPAGAGAAARSADSGHGATAAQSAASGRGLRALLADAAPSAPLLAALLCLSRFDPGHGVRDGGYGVQLALRLRLAPLELALGVDGLAAALLPLCALLGGLALQGERGRRARAPIAALLAAALALLCAQDGALLVLAWLALVSAAAGWLARVAGPRAAAALLGAGVGGAALLGLALGLAAGAAGPPPFAEGGAGGRLGLVPLSYLSYYGGQRLAGFPLSKVLLGLVALACAPLFGLPPLRGWLAAALRASPAAPLPAALLRAAAAAVLLRVGYGLAPDAAVSAAGALSALGAAAALGGGLGLRGESDEARRRAAALLLEGGLCLLGLASFTLTGLCGALLLLWAPLLHALGSWRPALATLAAPAGLGGLGWGAALALIGALPGARLATLVAGLGALLAAPAPSAATTAATDPAATADSPTPDPAAPSPSPAPHRAPTTLLALGAAALLALAPSAPLGPAATALRDLITHTSGHVGAAALALLRTPPPRDPRAR